jgi:hypothetical protein
MDASSSDSNKSKLLLIGGGGIAFFLVLTIMLLSLASSKPKTNEMTSQPSPTLSTPFKNSKILTQGGKTAVVRELPKVSLTKYTLTASTPTINPDIQSYILKTGFSVKDVTAIASQLGFSGRVVKETERDFILTNDTNSPTHYLKINKNSGAFFFSTTQGAPVENISDNYLTLAENYLNQIGIYDKMLKSTNYYKTKSVPGAVYVEVHRDWDLIKSPILSPLGILNTPEQVRLSSLKVGKVTSDSPADPDIVYSLDGFAGRARPIDFNTVLLVISEKDKKVLSVISNMRMISGIKARPAAITDFLKTPDEALTELNNGGSIFTLTLPTGAGIIDPAKVYPSENAIGKNPIITDFVVAYLEKTKEDSQTNLIPFYVFKGLSTLDSGYQVQFLQIVPALKTDQPKVLGATSIPTTTPRLTPIDAGLKYQTFEGASPVVGATGIPWNGSCPLFTNQYRIDNGIAKGYIAWFDPTAGRRNWYYVPDDPNEKVGNDVIDKLTSKCINDDSEECKNNNIIDDVIRDCPKNIMECPVSANSTVNSAGVSCYFLTTASPSLYLYPTEKTSFEVLPRPVSGITFVDPIFDNVKNSKWTGSVEPNGKMHLSNNNTISKLYYEYKKDPLINQIRSNLPQEGYVLRKDKLEELMVSLFTKLGLKDREKNDFMTEVRRETGDLNARFVRVSFIPENVLNTFLPVTVKPEPQSMYRIHFFIEPASGQEKLLSPSVKKLERKGYTVIETGVLVRK